MYLCEDWNILCHIKLQIIVQFECLLLCDVSKGFEVWSTRFYPQGFEVWSTRFYPQGFEVLSRTGQWDTDYDLIWPPTELLKTD